MLREKEAAMWLLQPGIQAMINDPHTKEAVRVAIRALKEREARKIKCVEKYRQALRSYFSDHTVEGGIAKRYYAEAVSDTLAEVFGMEEKEISRIYSEEYWKNQKKS